MEDDVCLHVLVSLLSGRLFKFFMRDSTMFFSPRNWAITLHLTSYYFLDFRSPQAKLRFKILIESSLYGSATPPLHLIYYLRMATSGELLFIPDPKPKIFLFGQ